MGSYAPNTVSGGDTVSTDWINAELQAIAAEFNTHSTADFPADSVPNSALVTNKGYCAVVLSHSLIDTKVYASALSYAHFAIPWTTATLVSCRFSKRGGSVATLSADIYLHDGSPATVLSAPVTVAADNTDYAASIATSSFNQGDLLGLFLDTAAGALTVANRAFITAVLGFKYTLVS